jgi:hypothetical protein
MKLPALPSLPRDPRAALQKARADLVTAEAKLSELAMARGKALVETDELEAVAAIDASINEQHKAISILTDRSAALARQVAQQKYAQRERDRDAAIDALQKDFARRHKLAQEVEEAVARFGSLWDELLNSREIALKNWPDQLFDRPSAGTFRSAALARELQWLLYSAGKPAGLRPCSIPAPSNAGLGIQGISPLGLSGAVAAEQEALIELLRSKPLPTEIDEEIAA